MTKNQLRQALRSAHWSAIHYTMCEYRVVLNDETQRVSVQELPEGSNGYYRGETVLKTFCFWPGLENSNGPVDAIFLNWLQSLYINEQLDIDMEDILEAMRDD